MSTIEKNGFYKLSLFKNNEIIITSGTGVILFDDCNFSKKIILEENSKLEIYGVVQKAEDFNLEIISKGNNSSLKVRYLLLATDKETTKAKVESIVDSSHSKSDVKIVSIVQNGGQIDIDGIIKINPGVEKVDGHLLEENLFLGNTGKVKGIPTLLVSSDDVKASHACRIERISDEKLFYLRSRGIEKENAMSMMIEAKIVDLFNCLTMVDSEFYESLIRDVLTRIK